MDPLYPGYGDGHLMSSLTPATQVRDEEVETGIRHYQRAVLPISGPDTLRFTTVYSTGPIIAANRHSSEALLHVSTNKVCSCPSNIRRGSDVIAASRKRGGLLWNTLIMPFHPINRFGRPTSTKNSCITLQVYSLLCPHPHVFSFLLQQNSHYDVHFLSLHVLSYIPVS